jgi:hypothetical protein
MLRLLLISLSLNLSAEEFTCLELGKFRVEKEGKKIEIKESYCLYHFNYKILSLNCLKDKNCLALSSYENTSQIQLKPKQGSPSHRKCSLLKGKPELIEYYNGKGWHQAGICRFPDASFVSTDNLIK